MEGGVAGPLAMGVDPSADAAAGPAAATAGMPGDTTGEQMPQPGVPSQQLPDPQTADQLQPEQAPGPSAGGSEVTVRDGPL